MTDDRKEAFIKKHRETYDIVVETYSPHVGELVLYHYEVVRLLKIAPYDEDDDHGLIVASLIEGQMNVIATYIEFLKGAISQETYDYLNMIWDRNNYDKEPAFFFREHRAAKSFFK